MKPASNQAHGDPGVLASDPSQPRYDDHERTTRFRWSRWNGSRACQVFSKLRVENFKCVRHAEVSLSWFNVFIGRNDSGKSSLLGALDYLSRAVRASSKESGLRTLEPSSDLVWRGASEKKLTVGVDLLGLGELDALAPRYSLSLGPMYNDPAVALEESLILSTNECMDKDGGMSVGGRRQRLPSVKEPPRQMAHIAYYAARDEQMPYLKPIVNALSSVTYLRLNPAAMAQPSVLEPGELPVLCPDGENLAGVLASLALTNREAFDRIQEAVRAAVPGIREILLPTESVRKKLEVEGEAEPRFARVAGHAIHFRTTKGWEIPASAASQGLLLFLAFATAAYGARPNQCLLVEEPENGIHPRALRIVVELLHRITEEAAGADRVQVLMTTHSPYLLDLAAPDEVHVLTREPDGEAAVQPLASAPHIRERVRELLLGELWYDLGEDALLGKA